MNRSPERWRRLLAETWRMNRVHVGKDTSLAYRRLAGTYPNVNIFGYDSGEKSGTWTVPCAWDLRRARLLGPDGSVVVDSESNPLHVFAFSPAFSGEVSRAELEDHLLSDPRRPDAVPFHFRNQYRHWSPEWGFCLPHSLRTNLPDGNYRVEIDTHFVPGRLEMAEQVHQGQSPESVLFVGHFDHPAMCNDGIVGCLAGHEALTRLEGRQTRLTYRMLSTVEIVGSVFYADREAKARNVREALFVATPGARAPLSYQESSAASAFMDRAVRHLLRHAKGNTEVRAFRSVFGNDEIAFDVGGVGIPCGSLMRFPFPEYHTSGDTPEAVDEANFEESVTLLLDLVDVYENNARLSRRFTGLPCLSNPELDLYLSPPAVSGVSEKINNTTQRLLDRLPHDQARAAAERFPAGFFNLMNLLPTMAEGNHTTLDLAERAGLPFAVVHAYSEMWVERGLLTKEWINPLGGLLGEVQRP